MLDCLIFGDSIAEGLQHFKKECVPYVQSNLSSKEFNNKFIINHKSDYGSEVAIISLGSYDKNKVKTEKELTNIRNKIKSERVYWILPNQEKFPNQFKIVNSVAQKFNDFVIKPKSYQKASILPTEKSYKEISKEIE